MFKEKEKNGKFKQRDVDTFVHTEMKDKLHETLLETSAQMSYKLETINMYFCCLIFYKPTIYKKAFTFINGIWQEIFNLPASNS